MRKKNIIPRVVEGISRRTTYSQTVVGKEIGSEIEKGFSSDKCVVRRYI